MNNNTFQFRSQPVSIGISSLICTMAIAYAGLKITNLHMVVAYALDLDVMIRRALLYAPLLLLAFTAIISIRPKTQQSGHLQLLLSFFLIYLTFGTFNTFWDLQFASFSAFAKETFSASLECLAFVVIVLFLENSKREQLINSITAILTIATFCNLLFLLMGFEFLGEISTLNTTYIGRPSGVTGNANEAGAMGCLALLFVAYQLLKPEFSPWWWLVLMMIMPCIFVTFSNTAQVISILILGLLFFYKARSLKGMVSTFTVLILLIGVALLFFPDLRSSLVDGQMSKLTNLWNLITLNLDGINFSNRNTLAAKGWYEILEHPILGGGLGVMANRINVHNTYFQLWGDAGVFAVILYCLLLLGFLVKGLMLRVGQPALSFLLIGFFLSITLYGFTTHNIIDRGKLLIPLVLLLIYSDSHLKGTTVRLFDHIKLRMVG